MGSFVEGTQSMPFGKDHVRKCMGMWLSNGLHHLWCETGPCYVAREECTCTFCGCAGVGKCHLLTFNRANIQQIVEVMQACNRHT